VRAVLLVVDLEGVAGVDDVESLVAVAPGFPRAQRLLTDEVAAAVRGLRAQGVERIRVSDSHRAGVRRPSVIAEELPGVEVRWEDDAYDPALFDGVDAVACLGMHAPAGTNGFAAHTVSVHCAFSAAGRAISETDMVLALAAERGIPALFVTGDDVLAAATAGPTFACTKHSLSPSAARSRPAAEAQAEIERAAGAPATPAPPLPGDLVITFKSRWQAEAAARAGGDRVGPHAVRASEPTFGEAYRRALPLVAASEHAMGAALRDHDRRVALQDIAGLLLRELPAGAAPRLEGEARRALASFLGATAGSRSWQRADRALVLHMLAGHAPGFFRAEGLAPALDEALRALAAVPVGFPAGLHPAEAMARVDALYLGHHHGAARAGDTLGLTAYVRSVAEAAPIFAWLLGELMADLGLARPVILPERALRAKSRLHDLYWLTHLYLLDTRYLARPLAPAAWETRTEELLLATPWALAGRRMDVAAEIAICLQLAGEGETAEHHRILGALRAGQHPDGRVADPSSEGNPDPHEAERLRSHATAASLVAFAGTLPV
jgi:D-amino peptidase